MAAAFLPISKPRAALRVPGRSVAAAFLRARCGAVCGGGGGLWQKEVVALRGGLWRRGRSVAKRRCGAVCGGGGGLWQKEVVALQLSTSRTTCKKKLQLTYPELPEGEFDESQLIT